MMAMPAPQWVTVVAWIVTILGGMVAGVMLADIYLGGYRQPLKAMEAVWPVTAIYAGPAAWWAYYRWGRPATLRWQEHHGRAPQMGRAATAAAQTLPGGAVSFVGHMIAMPLVMWTGWTIGGQGVWPMMLLIAAFALPLLSAFEYHALTSAGQIESAGRRWCVASRISILAIAAFDVGMGASMLVVAFVLRYAPDSMAFWLVMWAGMWLGFATAYPMVRWLLPKDTTDSAAPAAGAARPQVQTAR
ncbi:hypothetical protein AWC25_09140 [Mycobacterium sherrisii]|uniref:DUF4396 domain-containing protein n=2 Tax=Mycobacterium sherrisii TaxID=243061 RepID=A0A1E3T6Y7_9MYCO|nr:DUF4396 domain-containing protein [Mycobacterium sherrisii]ODR10147.1 hypothetical protein BHQ21_02885 [Mycobacterium sherrisii]ORW77340.1 hypothetical protein AWC25_09140 [Mycobacterium sherrisii]